MQFTSIRTKFLAFILPVVLIGFLIFFGISYKMASDMLDANAETIGTGLGKQTALDVQRVLRFWHARGLYCMAIARLALQSSGM